LHLGDAPARERFGGQGVQPGLLRGLRQVHPELEDERAVVGQRALEAEDALELLVELRRGPPPVDAVEDRPRVPGAEKEAHASARRQVAPEAPVLGALVFFFRQPPVGAGDDPAWIQPLAEQIDGLAFSGAVDAGKDDDHRERRGRQPPLHLEELGAQEGNARLVLLLRDLPAEFRRFEHAAGVIRSPAARCCRRSN
jgi:hypothetical protein